MINHLTRIKTGFILAVLTIITTFYFPQWLFMGVTWVVISAAFWEWLSLIAIRFFYHKVAFMVLFWVVMLAMQHHTMLTLEGVTVWWVLCAVLLFIPFSRLQALKHRWIQLIIGCLVLAPTWVAIVGLHAVSRIGVFYLIMLVCFADTGAYFVGTRFGKHKLIPRLSPKKSVEGLIGGLIIGSIAGMSMVPLMPHPLSGKYLFYWFVGGLVLIMISVVGDFFESMIKRLYEAKDSGSLLPGHGGFLDRLDSLSAAFPVYALVCLHYHIF